MKNNLEHSALPSPDEIRLYQEGKLGPMRSHEIELLAQENPLLAEALEGFSVKPAYNMLPLIQAGVIQASGGAAATGGFLGGGAVVAKTVPWWHLNGWWIGIVTGTVAATGTAVIIQSSDEKNNSENIQQVPVEQTQSELNVEQPVAELRDTVNYATAHQDLLTPVPQTISDNSSQQNIQSTPVELPQDSENRDPSSGETISSITASDEDLKLSQNSEQVDISTKKSSTIAIGIIHVFNYKLADYTAIRQNSWQKFSLDEVGVPAKFDNEEQQKKYLAENPDQAVPYVAYVTQCIKAYDENKFSLALSKFGEILAQYPDDVNALFYSGMSNYMLGNYANAISFYEKAEKNYIHTFNEEAMFYHAKSLKKLGRLDEASSYLVKVVRYNGFYKEHAIKELETDE